MQMQMLASPMLGSVVTEDYNDYYSCYSSSYVFLLPLMHFFLSDNVIMMMMIIIITMTVLVAATCIIFSVMVVVAMD